MSEPERNTLELIHTAAKAEFMEKGFQAASLRNIVKTAGVTTGAFYGYYDSKEELFAALVDPAYEYMMGRYKQTHEYFESLPMEKQPEQMGKMSSECMNELLAYSCEHMDEFYLILKCSAGTKYASMIDDMVEIEVEATHKYYKVLEQLGTPAPKIDERLEHIMATGMIGAFFELGRGSGRLLELLVIVFLILIGPGQALNLVHNTHGKSSLLRPHGQRQRSSSMHPK